MIIDDKDKVLGGRRLEDGWHDAKIERLELLENEYGRRIRVVFSIIADAFVYERSMFINPETNGGLRALATIIGITGTDKQMGIQKEMTVSEFTEKYLANGRWEKLYPKLEKYLPGRPIRVLLESSEGKDGKTYQNVTQVDFAKKEDALPEVNDDELADDIFND